jgi:predicted dehydrogenase
MGKKIRIGIIGAGNIAQNAHIPAYVENEDAELVGVCDLNLERAQQVKEKYGMKYAVTDFNELVAKDDIDAVSICVWNNAHASAAIAAAKAGKHVMCEKPMAMTVEQGIAMKKAAEENNIIFMMGFTRRYEDKIKVITDMLESGALGEIYYANVKELRRRGTPLGWFTDKEKSGGGPIIDIGVHSIYSTWYTMGKPKPISVSAQVHSDIGDYKTKMMSRWNAFDTDDLVYSVEDSGEGMIRFENGAVMLFENSWAINGEGSGMNIRLYGSKGGATLDPFRIYQEQNGYLLDAQPHITKKSKSFENEINHYIECVQQNKEPITTVDDGITIQKILDGIYESAKQGKEVLV